MESIKRGADRAAAIMDTQKKQKLAKELSANSGGGEVRIHKRMVVLFVIVILLHRA